MLHHLGNRIRNLIRGGATSPRERSIANLMAPPSAFQSVYEDEPVQRVIQVLTKSLFHAVPGKLTKKGHPSVLVYSRDETFLGCIRLNDVLDLLIPPPCKEAFAPFEPGMFVQRRKLLGTVTVGEILPEQRFVDIDAPLIEAVQLMVVDSLVNLPVLEEGNLVGILTDTNLLVEISDLAAGDATTGATLGQAQFRRAKERGERAVG
jgi:CBS domain-containing protein